MTLSDRRLGSVCRRDALLGAAASLAFGSRAIAHQGDGDAMPPSVVLQSCLEEGVARGIPGLSAAIAIGGKIAWTGVAGFSDLQRRIPLTPDKLLGIGSITKPFVAAIILQLIDEGRLRIDDRLDVILGDMVDRIANSGATIGQMLSHSSGIPNWEWVPSWIREGRGADLDVARIWGKAETLPYIFDLPAVALSGTAGDYSNSNYTLLGLVVEKVTGRNIAQELRTRIFEPLSLQRIYLEGFMPSPDAMPRRYHWATEAFRSDAGINPAFVKVSDELIDVSASNLSVEWTAGGLVATASDLARFGSALQGAELLPDKASRVMRRWDVLIQGRDFGHGLYREHLAGGRAVIGHDGSVLGFSSSMFWIEGQDAVFAVLANVGTMHSGSVPVSVYSITRQPKFVEALSAFAEKGDAAARRGEEYGDTPA